ncbi:DUF7159 family protein [Mycolicibacterium lutetiense]
MDVVIGIAMTSRDAQLLLVEGSHGDGAVIDHDSFDADTHNGIEHPGFREHVVNAVIDSRAAAPANGHTVTRVALTWTDAVASEAKLVLDDLEELGIAKVAVVSTTDALEAAAVAVAESAPGAESLVEEVNSVMSRSVVLGDDAALLLARGALLASADVGDEAVSAPKRDPLMRTLTTVVATAVLIVAGSVFLAFTVQGNDGGPPPQASTLAEHTAPAEPPIHAVVRKVVPLAGRAAQQSLVAPDADTTLPPLTGVVRR